MAGLAEVRLKDRRSSGLSGPTAAGGCLCFFECEANFLQNIRRERASLCILDISLGVFGTGGADDRRMHPFDAEREAKCDFGPDIIAAFETEVLELQSHFGETIGIGFGVTLIETGLRRERLPGGVGNRALGEDSDI